MIPLFILLPTLIAISYLFGSIPFGLILTKLAGLGDIRNIGSGNIGATNVLRTGHKGLAFLTLALDAAKGAAPVLIFMQIDTDLAQLAGICALLGHIFPVWLHFKGGKGVATALGIMLALSWQIAIVSAIVWITTVLLFRISSLGAILAVGTSPFIAFFTGHIDLSLFCFSLATLILIKHRDNIRRIIAGNEPKIGQKKA